MSDEVQGTDEVVVDANPHKALLVEFDLSLMPGVQCCRDACREVLADKDIELDDGRFARYFVTGSLNRGLSMLKAGSGPAAEELIVKIHETLADKILDPACKPRAGMVELVKGVVAEGVRVVLVSHLPEERLKARLAEMGLDGELVDTVLERPDRSVGYGAESWRRMTHRAQLNERLCVALVCCGFSAKSALAAGLRVVAVADPLVAFEDYSGADCVVESADDAVLNLTLELLRVR